MRAGVVAGVLACVLTLALGVNGGDIVIASFDRNGRLTWTNSQTNVACHIEWASSLTGSWSRSWAELKDIHAMEYTNEVCVPMFYRVASSTSTVETCSWNGTGFDWRGSSTYAYCLTNTIVGSAVRGVLSMTEDGEYLGTFPLEEGVVAGNCISFNVTDADDYTYYFTMRTGQGQTVINNN